MMAWSRGCCARPANGKERAAFWLPLASQQVGGSNPRLTDRENAPAVERQAGTHGSCLFPTGE